MKKLVPIVVLGLIFAIIAFWQLQFKKDKLPIQKAIPKVLKKTEEKSDLQFTVAEDRGIRVSGSVPYAYRLANGRVRLYYCRQGIQSAISDDGLNFVEEGSIGIDGCDPTIVKTDDGRFRLYYKIQSGEGGPGQAIHKIFSAISSDGVHFQKEGLRIDSEKTDDEGWASVPEAIQLPDGRVRIYYVTGNSQVDGSIASAIANDGLNFRKEKGVRTKDIFVDPAITILADGRFWLLAVYNCRPEKGKCGDYKNGLYGFFSSDGLNFSAPQLIYEANDFIDPAIFKIGENKYRIYYWQMGRPGEEMKIKSITLLYKE